MKRCGVVLWWCAVVGVAKTAWTAQAPHVTDLLISLYEASTAHRLPTWESPITVFGVKAESDVGLILLHPSGGTNVTISIQVSEFSSETMLTYYSQDPDGSETVVSRDKVSLSLHHFTWFTVYRSKNFIGLFAEDQTRLILGYTQPKGNTSFLEYTDFRVQSYYDAVWDFLGMRYSGLGNGPGYVQVVQEVHAVAKALLQRLLMLEHVLDTKPLDAMPRTTKETFFVHLQRTESFIFLCRFYGFDFMNHTKIFPWERLKLAFEELHASKGGAPLWYNAEAEDI